MASVPIPFPAGLTDGVVSVRARRLEDVPVIVAALDDPEIRRWLDDPPRPGETPAENLARTTDDFRSGRAAPLVIADARSDEPVGLINLQLRGGTWATLAYSVFPTGRGRGIAVRAVRLVQGWAAREVGQDELRLEIDRDNLPSLRVAAKLGWRELTTSGPGSGKRVFTTRAI